MSGVFTTERAHQLPICWNYAAVVEHESHDTFMAMHTGPEHEEAGRRVMPLFEGKPTPRFYEVIAE